MINLNQNAKRKDVSTLNESQREKQSFGGSIVKRKKKITKNNGNDLNKILYRIRQ